MCSRWVVQTFSAGLGRLGVLDPRVPLALAGPPSLIVYAEPPVARDREPLQAHPPLEAEVAPQFLHGPGLAVHERLQRPTLVGPVLVDPVHGPVLVTLVGPGHRADG